MLIKTDKIKSIITIFFTTIFIITTINFPNKKTFSLSIVKQQTFEIANEVAILLNQEREALGLNPLYVVPYLNECAEIRAKEQSELEGHVRPNGEWFSDIVVWDTFQWGLISENIALGALNAKDAIDMWKESPKHWGAATNENYTHTGIAVYYDENSKYKWSYVQIFTNDAESDVVHEGQYLPTNHVIVPADNGDINGDAVINTFDYIGLVEYIRKSKERTPVYFNDEQIKAADCFKDGIITEADAKVLRRYILGEYKSLPFEF